MPLGATKRQQIEEAHRSITLPLVLGSTGPDLNDEEFLLANGVRVVLRGHQPFFVAMKALYESMAHLHTGGTPSSLRDRVATDDLRKALLRDGDYAQWRDEYLS